MIKKIEWDSDFFGFLIGRLDTSEDTSFEQFLIDANEFKLTYVFSNYPLNWVGLKHVDTKLVFQKEVKYTEESDFDKLDEISISCFNPETDSYTQIENLAYLSGNFSRFKLDKKFGENNYRELYKKWLDESIKKNIADYVLVANYKTKIVGFVSLKLDSLGNGQIGLIAVNSDFQGRRIASNLIKACEEQIGVGQFLKVPTQEANTKAVKLYYKNNFEIVEKSFVYHYWQ